MIIDGWSTKVELYNYETGQQCFLPDTPNPNYNGNAGWLNDTAVVCVGGAAYEMNCTIFDKALNTWIKVRLKKYIYLIKEFVKTKMSLKNREFLIWKERGRGVER
jgi:hypothetical protein